VLARSDIESLPTSPGNHCARISRPKGLTNAPVPRIILSEGCFLLSVSLPSRRNQTLERSLSVFFSVLVFFFALHAKTAVYNGGVPVRTTPSTASKLWLSGQKTPVPSLETISDMLFWTASLYLLGLYLQPEHGVPSTLLTPPLRNLPLRHLNRFLRPPPIQN
jgi:hypothetical protein